MIKQGLVFGKFMPIHKGHLALIDFAKSQCEELIVSMSFMPDDVISHELRFRWLQEIFKDKTHIKVVQHLDDFHDENLPIFEATKLWAKFIKINFPAIEAFFCSESYGEPLSFHLKMPCVFFDESRIQIPVAASKIRQNPMKYWDFIPEIVIPYFVKKMCLFGPESTGKTVLSQKLALKYETDFVPEAAREILTNNEIDEDIILKIGNRQTQLVEEKCKTANRILFCDTDLITTQIYANHYLGYIPEVLFELEKRVKYDLYFLLDIDVDWVPDPLRDLGQRREEMFAKFKQELDNRKINYLIISGRWEERLEKMVNKLNQYFEIH